MITDATCEKAAEAVTQKLGFDCHDVSPVVSRSTTHSTWPTGPCRCSSC